MYNREEMCYNHFNKAPSGRNKRPKGGTTYKKSGVGMKDKVRVVSLIVVDIFMTFCLLFSILVRRDAASGVLCGFGTAFTTYMLTATLIPNREKEYSRYKRIYAPHLVGIFQKDNRDFTRLLRIISFLNNVNPKIGIMYAPKLLTDNRSDRERAVVNYFCGVCCENSGDMMKARDHYISAVRFDPKYNQAHLRLAIIYDRLGDFEPELEAFEKGLSFGKKRPHECIEIIESARLSVDAWETLGQYVERVGGGENNFVFAYIRAVNSAIASDSEGAEKFYNDCVRLGASRDGLRQRLEYHRHRELPVSEE